MEVAAPATAALGRRDAAVEVLQMNGAESTSASARRYNETLAKARAAGDLTYRCLAAAPIRATVDASSSQLGTLKAHETFRAVREIVKDGHRVLEMDRGWVDMAAKSGKPIVVLEAAVQTFLTTVPLLQNLTQTERDQVAKVLDAEDFQTGFPIAREGDRGDAMYFLEEGKAEATIANAQGKAELVRHYARGDFFGDMALLTDSPRTETVTAGRTGDRGQEGARMLKLSAKVFNEFAARCPAILEVQRQEYAKAHVVDISDAALESYLGRHDLFDTLFTNGARVIAEPPSPRALRTLRQIIARAPPRIKKQNGHYQQIGRRLTDDFLAEEMVGHDLDLLVRVWQPAIGRVATTYMPVEERDAMSKSAAYERSMMLRTPSKGSKAAPWQVLDNPAAFYNDDPKMRPVDQAQAQAYGKTAGASPEPEPEPEPAPFIPEGVPTPLKARTKELARNSRTLPLTPRRDEQSGPYPLTAAARQHVRNLFALGRDVDNMLDKFGLDPEIITKPFGDPQSQSPDNLLASSERDRLSLSDAGKFAESFRACLQPFVDYFVQCDNYAGSLYGRAVTVECVDRYGMKLISKVFVKMYDPRTQLFLVEWGAGEREDEQSWVRLRDLRGGWLDHPQADPNGWLGFHARAQDASPEAAADANRRRRPGSPHASPQTDDI